MADFDDEAADRVRGRGSGKGKGRVRGGGGGGGGGQNREVLISKALSRLLRHQANDAGIRLDDEGFAPLDKVLQWPPLRSLNSTLAEIRQTVADNAKQRFTLKPAADGKEQDKDSEDAARWLIRANQGHSIELASEALHTPITLEAGNVPDVVVHGTYFAFWPAIVSSGGLKKMGRQHVHFGTGVPGGGDDDSGTKEKQQQQIHDVAEEAEENDDAKGKGEGRGGKEKEKEKVISGMRADAEILVFVDVARSLRDGSGIAWWLSANGVVLTEGDADGLVPARYFREVRGRRQGVGVLWRDGEKVADLPEGIVARVPFGKGGTRGSGGGGACGCEVLGQAFFLPFEA
ncbi:RNA 2'-phosphotransferase, Tpt1 [Biscogniauxia marginata]|nr:RNA 2'-phosphotransferase, Tpt1 [Biscogniauxia marginata]